MKKITLLLIICFTFSFNGHAQLFSEDFEGGWQGYWVKYEGVDDGFNQNFSSQSGRMISKSFNTPDQYFPDNYVVTPAIDVTGMGNLSLAYNIGDQYVNFGAEPYTVYVSIGNTVTDLEDPLKTVSFTEDLQDDPAVNNSLVPRIFNASALDSGGVLDGATTVYIAFRHFYYPGDSRQEFLKVDDVVLTGTTLGLDDNVFSGFNYFVDKQHVLQLSSSNKNLDNVSIYNLLGQNILTNTLSSRTASIDLSELSSGVYIAKVNIDGTSNSFKILKN